ncbi:MAG: hypothetical protein JST68_27190 [Bacteroidetes bacterium]|nr:hypothetical protein [Bacteroidota bacterium]
MGNIATEILEDISGRTGNLVNEINEGVKWVESYLQEDHADSTAYELKKYRRYLRNIQRIITKKTVISLFGKSQVGKSYLVDGILSTTKQKELKIPDPVKGSDHYFIGELNPPGGKESTGVVSRFSIERHSHYNSMPIEIKLLSPKDIILILCDTYYSDIKYYKDPLETTQIKDFLADLPQKSSGARQYFLTEDDVYDIKDYLEKYFADKPVIRNFEDAGFWKNVSKLVDQFAPDRWVSVFDLLWGGNERISKLFTLLINELQLLEFSNTVHTPFDALLIKEGSILDVQRIFELESDPFKPISVRKANGREQAIRRSTLAALTYEVTIPVKEELAEEKKFLKDVDILDFPGARGREMYHEGDIPSLKTEDFYNFYRRGKVAYLFNRYTENYEISSLLFCIDNEQLEVKNIPVLLNNWINYYIGENPEERARTLQPNMNGGPLLIVFTKANLMLQYKPVDADKQFDYKWETRFKSIFINEYCQVNDWPYNWIKTDNRVEKFKNLFLLRSFNYPEYIYEGFKEGQREIGIAPGRQEYMNDLHKSFVNYPFNKDHFYNPEESWSEFTGLNKDGSEYIIRNLTPIANNTIRSFRYVNLLDKFKQNAIKALGKYYHNDQADGQIRRASREGAEIHAVMNIIFGKDAYHFGSFIEHLTIAETEIFDYYHRELKDIALVKAPAAKQYQLIREGSPRMRSDKTYAENLEILRQDYHRDTTQEAEEFFTNMGIDLMELFYGGLYNLKNNSEVLAEGARDHWFNTRLTLENFQEFIDLGFEKSLLLKLLDNLKANFNKLNLVKIIASSIRAHVDTLKRVDLTEDMIAHITTSIINEFVTSVGWSFFSDSDKKKIAETNAANDLHLIIPEEVDSFHSLSRTVEEGGDQSVEKLIDFMDHLSENLNRIPLDIDTIKNIPMIRHYRRWRELMKISFIANCDIPTYNVEANRLLGGLLEKMKLYEFNLA